MFTSETLTLVWNFFLIFFLKKKLFGHVTQNNSPIVKMKITLFGYFYLSSFCLLQKSLSFYDYLISQVTHCCFHFRCLSRLNKCTRVKFDLQKNLTRV